MRREPTPAEALLWQELRRGRIAGVRFRRQHPIDPLIVDFYCAKAKLVVEVDGGIHRFTKKEDADRQQNLEQRGLAVIRVTNEEVLSSVQSAAARIEGAVKARLEKKSKI